MGIGGQSLAAGTRVLTASGALVAISKLRKGDKVLATRPCRLLPLMAGLPCRGIHVQLRSAGAVSPVTGAADALRRPSCAGPVTFGGRDLPGLPWCHGASWKLFQTCG